MVHIVLEKEPRFLPAESSGDWICISHRGKAKFSVRHTTNKSLQSCILGCIAFQWRGTVIYSYTRDEIPIPSSCDILVFVAMKVSMKCPIRKMEPQRLNKL